MRFGVSVSEEPRTPNAGVRATRTLLQTRQSEGVPLSAPPTTRRDGKAAGPESGPCATSRSRVAPRCIGAPHGHGPAGWRMASTAMRLGSRAACMRLDVSTVCRRLKRLWSALSVQNAARISRLILDVGAKANGRSTLILRRRGGGTCGRFKSRFAERRLLGVGHHDS